MNKWKKVTMYLISFVMVFVFLSGCRKKDISIQNKNQIDIAEIPNQDSSGKIIITDQVGRQVELKSDNNRIVSAYYISSSLLIALGAKDKVVGIEMKADTREIYKRAAPEFLHLPAVGSGKGINIEATAALEPDLVILPLKLKDSVKQFDELGIPVIIIDPETIDRFMECVNLLGEVSGCEQKSQDLIKYYQDKITMIEEKTKNLDQKPTIYLSAGSSYLNTCTSKMYQNDLIQMAGGINVSASLTNGYWQTISAEELLKWNPERMFFVSYAEYTKTDILNDNRLADIDAIKNNNLEVFPSNLEPWDYPTTSSVLGLLWLTNKLHPDLYSTEDYENEVQSFYKEFFQIEVGAEDI